MSSLIADVPAHAVFDVVIDDEIQFLVGEAVMFGEELVDLASKIGPIYSHNAVSAP